MKDKIKFDYSLDINLHHTHLWLPWKTAARNTGSPQSENTDQTRAGKINLQGVIEMKIQSGEGKRKR